MVHDNLSLTLLDEFSYLLNCLFGLALAVVKQFQVKNETYPKAPEKLKNDNKVLRFVEHINVLSI